jgi:hypothetical protein
MQDTITLAEHGFRAVLAAHPVTRESYKQFLRDTGQPTPPALTRPEPASNPVTYVSQVDALAYCRWFSGRGGHAYRLPTMGELQEVAGESTDEGISPDFWPHTHGRLIELRGGLKPVYLCEWTLETETIEQPSGRPPRVLGSIFYPPWLREGPNATHAEAHLLATEGYSFVTFRVAYDP